MSTKTKNKNTLTFKKSRLINKRAHFTIRRIANQNPRNARTFFKVKKRFKKALTSLLTLLIIGGALFTGGTGQNISSESFLADVSSRIAASEDLNQYAGTFTGYIQDIDSAKKVLENNLVDLNATAKVLNTSTNTLASAASAIENSNSILNNAASYIDNITAKDSILDNVNALSTNAEIIRNGQAAVSHAVSESADLLIESALIIREQAVNSSQAPLLTAYAATVTSTAATLNSATITVRSNVATLSGLAKVILDTIDQINLPEGSEDDEENTEAEIDLERLATNAEAIGKYSTLLLVNVSSIDASTGLDTVDQSLSDSAAVMLSAAENLANSADIIAKFAIADSSNESSLIAKRSVINKAINILKKSAAKAKTLTEDLSSDKSRITNAKDTINSIAKALSDSSAKIRSSINDDLDATNKSRLENQASSLKASHATLQEYTSLINPASATSINTAIDSISSSLEIFDSASEVLEEIIFILEKESTAATFRETAGELDTAADEIRDAADEFSQQAAEVSATDPELAAELNELADGYRSKAAEIDTRVNNINQSASTVANASTSADVQTAKTKFGQDLQAIAADAEEIATEADKIADSAVSILDSAGTVADAIADTADKVGQTIDSVVGAAKSVLSIFGIGSGTKGPALDGPGLEKGFDKFGRNYKGNKYESASGMIIGWTNFALPFISILAIAALIFAGFLYITAMGNPEQSEKAKKIIIWVIIGIIVVFAAYAVVNTLISGDSST